MVMARWLSRDRVIPLLGVVMLATIFVATRQIDWRIIHPPFLTGYCLAVLLLSMLLLSLRKQLPGMPLGLASTWLHLHVVVGVVLLPCFWLHIGRIWPNGLFEQVIAAIFYLVVLSGVVGRLMQKIIPANLTTAGGEVTRERIPREIIRLRLDVEQLLVGCTEETGKRSLAIAYEQTLAWYFRRPRFILAHIMGASTARHWFDNHVAGLIRSLDETERGYLDQICKLADGKHALDLHYALQMLLRSWLFIHAPLAFAFFVFVAWHVALVHVYVQ